MVQFSVRSLKESISQCKFQITPNLNARACDWIFIKFWLLIIDLTNRRKGGFYFLYWYFNNRQAIIKISINSNCKIYQNFCEH